MPNVENINKDLLGELSKASKGLEALADSIKDKNDAINLFGVEKVHDGKYKCKSCGKLVPASELIIFDTPVVKGVVAYLCKDCWHTVVSNKLWKLVCVGCKEFKQAMEPGVNPKNGFTFEPGKCYHLLQCPSCHPENFDLANKKQGEVIALPLIEEILYDQKLKERISKGEKLS